MSLNARVSLVRGDLELDVELAVADGEVLAVVGPNGAGKSTLVRALAGLASSAAGPTRARVEIDGVDHGSLPPDRRPIGVAFQDRRLFPHLSAVDNVAYPLRARGMGRRAARAAATEELRAVGIGDDAATRLPDALSGGEAQRVALARALVGQPRVALLDEPFAALDAAFRPTARAVLAERLAGVAGATVLVTHDVADALVLADRVLVLEDGTVTQVGSVAEVARRPATRYAAQLVGTNLLPGVRRDGRVRSANGLEVVAAEVGPDGPVRIVIAPAAVALHPSLQAGSPRNCWRGTVGSLEVLGSRARVAVDTGGEQLVAEVTFAAVDELQLRPGSEVWATVKATEVDVVTLATPGPPVW